MSKEKRFYMEKEELITLVENLQNSVPGSDDAIRAAFTSKIYGHLVKRTKSEQIAERLLDDVFSEIFCSIQKLRTPEAFVTWCNLITEHQIAAFFRKYRKELKIAQEYTNSRQASVSDAKKDRAYIAAGIEKLPPRQAETARLYYQKGYSVKEVAEMLGVPEGTIKSRLFYARKTLQEIEEKEHPQN